MNSSVKLGYDPTSSYFEGKSSEGLAPLGSSIDHELGKSQIVIGLIMEELLMPNTSEPVFICKRKILKTLNIQPLPGVIMEDKIRLNTL